MSTIRFAFDYYSEPIMKSLFDYEHKEWYSFAYSYKIKHRQRIIV